MSQDFLTRQAQGLSHLRQNQQQAAYDHFVALARDYGAHAEPQYWLGLILLQAGHSELARGHLVQATILDPSYEAAWGDLGAAHLIMGAAAPALKALHRAAHLAPPVVERLVNLCAALMLLGRAPEALSPAELAARLAPDMPEAQANLGQVYRQLKDFDLAIAALKSALHLRPAYEQAWSDLISVLLQLGRLDQAMDAIEQALRRLPESLDIRRQRAFCLSQLGEVDQSYKQYQQLLSPILDTEIAGRAFRGYINLLSYLPSIKPDFVATETRRLFDALKLQALQTHHSAERPTTTDRRLRIAYLSGDFRHHAVARNILPLLAEHDREQVHVTCYSDTHAPDAMTQEIASHVDAFISSQSLSDHELAARIAADGIDVLVVLAGRFNDNRYLIGAHRAAPVQISFHDGATSAMPELDYLIADPILVPRHTPEQFTERVLRLPHFFLHAPMDDAPMVRPRRSDQRLTFASFNNPCKINAEVLQLWREVLHQSPEARLVLHYGAAYECDRLKQRIIDGLQIEPARIHFAAPEILSRAAHLDLYNEVDICLDTAPFSGSTATFEALYMGVPVLTLPSWQMLSRWSYAILHGIGLDDLVAGSADEFVAKATSLAKDHHRRATLRCDLRQIIDNSPLVNAKARARQLERIFYRSFRLSAKK
jgi:predicted O-linked N-acetylglucosamine transferase (SPINDLY family)